MVVNTTKMKILQQSGGEPGSQLLNQLSSTAAAGRPGPPSVRKVARFVRDHPGTVLTSSAAKLASQLGLSDATVIRAVQSLGFDGLPELRRALVSALEGSTLAGRMQRTFSEVGEDAGHAIDVTLEAHQEGLAVVQSAEVREKLKQAAGVLAPAERIAVFGIGPSAMLAQYAAMLLARMGRPAFSLDRTGIALADQLLALTQGDALLLLAYGRGYAEVRATIARGRALGLPMVLVTDSLAPGLARQMDVIVATPRGRAERVALHGATLVVLEALVLGLAAMDRSRAVRALQELGALREAVTAAGSSAP